MATSSKLTPEFRAALTDSLDLSISAVTEQAALFTESFLMY